MPSDQLTIRIKAPFDDNPRRRVSRRLHGLVVHFVERKPQPGYIYVGPACHRVPMRSGNCTSDLDKVTCRHCRRSRVFYVARDIVAALKPNAHALAEERSDDSQKRVVGGKDI